MHLLGAILAVLSAATFALTNATGRRGVISGIAVPKKDACADTGDLLGESDALIRRTVAH